MIAPDSRKVSHGIGWTGVDTLIHVAQASVSKSQKDGNLMMDDGTLMMMMMMVKLLFLHVFILFDWNE